MYVITGSTDISDRIKTYQTFQESGGLLLTTDASGEGVNLQFVDVCVNYDLPITPHIFSQRIGRFMRLGRENNLQVITFEDDSEILSSEKIILNSIRKFNFFEYFE